MKWRSGGLINGYKNMSNVDNVDDHCLFPGYGSVRLEGKRLWWEEKGSEYVE